MRDLVTFYEHHSHQFSGNGKWCQALKRFLLKEPIDKTLLLSLLKTQSSQDYIKELREIVSLALLLRFQPHPKLCETIKQSLKEHYSRGFWKTYQLAEGLYALGCHLVDLPLPEIKPLQLKRGGLLKEMGNHLANEGVPHTIFNGELALIWLFLGWETSNDALLQAGLKWIYLSLNLFDHMHHPFHGIWLKESEYEPTSFFSLQALLFGTASYLTESSKIGHVADCLFEKLESVYQNACAFPPAFYILLAAGIESLKHEKSRPEIDMFFTLSDVDESMGYLSARQNHMSFACSFNGVNMGLGALHKNQVRIVSFGPHFTPLADSDRYGFHRISSKSFEAFHDLEWDTEPESFEIKGWARLISPIQSESIRPGKQWLYFSALGEGDQMLFETRLYKKEEKYPLFFAYFVTAKKASIESGEVLIPGTLHRYDGKSQTVTFHGGEEKLEVKPKFEGEMQVIPLAGENHFWSADFLMAFHIENDQAAYQWELQ